MDLFGRHAETAALDGLPARAAGGAGAAGFPLERTRARLLIGPRTVGHHLANVYPELVITSHAELARIDLDGSLRLGATGG